MEIKFSEERIPHNLCDGRKEEVVKLIKIGFVDALVIRNLFTVTDLKLSNFHILIREEDQNKHFPYHKPLV